LSLPAVLSPHKGVKPTSEPDRATLEDVEHKLAHSEAVGVETAPKETPKFQKAMMPVPSCGSTWPSPVVVEKMLIKYNAQLLTFQTNLVAEQFIITDVIGCVDQSGGRHFCDPFCTNLAFPGADSFFPFKSMEQHE
jgi:hypothetical protein